MNYFGPKDAAERYAKGRPDFHENTISHILKHLNLDTKLNKALDIACGTGLSTKALLNIAVHVFGTDTSEEMLKWALAQDKITYSIAPAENQPFPNQEFDLISVCSAVHWFDIDRFLLEANRLLKKGAWLVLYDNFFLSEMQGLESFGDWYPEVYLKKFPAPKRNNTYAWTNANLAAKNFTLTHEEEFTNHISFTKEELMLYFTTQSNITAQIEAGLISYKEVEDWLSKELSTFYLETNTRVLIFGNWIKYLQRNA